MTQAFPIITIVGLLVMAGAWIPFLYANADPETPHAKKLTLTVVGCAGAAVAMVGAVCTLLVML